MDRLILASLRGTASQREEQELLRWRQTSPENEEHYRAMARVWALAEVAEPKALSSSPPDAAAIIARAEESDGAQPARYRAGGTLTRWTTRAAVAAALLIAGFGVAELRRDGAPDDQYGAQEFVTGADETATVGLRDGSVVRLAPHSRLRISANARHREVSLVGRAYFAVAKQEDHPFRIRTDAGDVTVLGTRFDLAANADDLSLVVVEGKVTVSARGQETVVEAGELSRVVEGTVLPVMRAPDVQALVEWKGNFLAFQRTPLRNAAREIERQYHVRIRIADSALADRTITTWLADRPLDEVLRIVCAVTVADCVTRGDTVLMSPSSGSEP
jgi:ferric-dicitrate binding protein FerR (iron transport regulator)